MGNMPAAAHRVVALSASAEGLQAISTILAKLPGDFPAPIVIVQHPSPHAPTHTPAQIADILRRRTALRVKEAKEGERLQVGTVYFAPPSRHLIVHPDEKIGLPNAERAYRSRSAVDILFSSLASSVRARAIGVVLTGGDGDGTAGIQAIRAAGGVTLAQEERTSQDFGTPRPDAVKESVDLQEAASVKEAADLVLPLPEIAATLVALVSEISSPGASSASAVQPEAVTQETAAFAATALDRVQAAWRSAENFPGSGTGFQQVSRLMTKALEELDDCVDALRFAEQALIGQNRALEHYQLVVREERLRYQALLEVVSDGVITTDLKGVIRAINPAAAGLLGRNPKYMVGPPIEKYVRRGESLVFQSVIAQALVTGSAKQGLGLSARGSSAPVTATASAIEGERGMLIGLHWLICSDKRGAPET